ncbi:hypothetical protein BMS3Abin07_00599 [bacterium BMS3Abin07]|nr:hypothetical protein BMS3Abin07_00599 [bacterium BMS3Abin07]HDO22488.1 hypothetical protein [Nitrospirota bacterium]
MIRICMNLLAIVFLFLLSCSTGGDQPEYQPPSFKGIVYVQPVKADHVAVLNLANGETGRIGAGKSLGSISLSKSGNALDLFSVSGSVRRIDFVKHSRSKWRKVFRKPCSTATAGTGEILVTDSRRRRLYSYLPGNIKAHKEMKIARGTCGVSVSRDGKEIYLVNRLTSSIRIIRKDGFELLTDIRSAGNSIHKALIAPSGTELWVAEGNEFRKGKPYGVGFAKVDARPGGINIVSIRSGKVEDFIIVGGNVVDLAFSGDGRYAFALSSQMPEYDEASLTVINVKKRRVIKNYALCKTCHVWKGVDIPGAKAFVSSMQVDEKSRPEKITASMDMPFFSSRISGNSLIEPSSIK